MIVALNKSELDHNDNSLKFIEKFGDKFKIFKISAATTEGIKELIDYVTEELDKTELEEFALYEEIDEDFLEEFYNKEIDFDLNVRKENEIYLVYGKRVDNLLKKINIDDYDSMIYFESTLREMEVFDKLKEMGIEDGDSVAVGDIVFEYYE